MYAAQNPMILSAETEGEKAIQYVGGLLQRLDELQKKAYSFKTYQKTFKVCGHISIQSIQIQIGLGGHRKYPSGFSLGGCF